jgi:hypothetical protein
LSGTLCTFPPLHTPQMEVEFDAVSLQLYLGVMEKANTLQDFIDSISNKIENNRIKSHLHNFLQRTQEIDQFYNLANQNCSPRFTFQQGQDQNGNPQIFQYFIRKMQLGSHYCLYISIPANHPLYGRPYEEMQEATYSRVDEEDPSRWVFGWDYTHAGMLTLTSIYHYYAANPAALLDMQIITNDVITEDINQYMHILAG